MSADPKLYRQRKRREFEEFKKTLKCIDCGIQDHRVLQFHHRNKNSHAKIPSGKKYRISTMVAAGNTTLLKTELEKCDVLCANCHTIRHYMGPAEVILDTELRA